VELVRGEVHGSVFVMFVEKVKCINRLEEGGGGLLEVIYLICSLYLCSRSY
jgi:hypothetical protein